MKVVLITSFGLLLILGMATSASFVQAANTIQPEVLPVNYETNDVDIPTALDTLESFETGHDDINVLEQFSFDPTTTFKLKRSAYGLLRLTMGKPYHKTESQLTFAAPKMSTFIPVRGRREAFHKIRSYIE